MLTYLLLAVVAVFVISFYMWLTSSAEVVEADPFDDGKDVYCD